MVSTILACAAILAASPAPVITGSADADKELAAYREIKSKAGRAPDSQVRLALWCEAHGLRAERLKHLALAVLSDPSHATARGLLGLVDFRGQWQSPRSVAAGIEGDETYGARLAEYDDRRDRMGRTADDHWKLALWCEENGLADEATVHLTVATQLDPDHEAAWKRLGFKKLGGRWTTETRLAAEKAEAEARRRGLAKWKARFVKWRSWLGDRSKREKAIHSLANATDPRAVPAAWAVFANGGEADQAVAVGIFGRIDSPESTRALTLMAIAGESPEVRRIATETLRMRDPREIGGFLVKLLRNPGFEPDAILFRYTLTPIGSEGVGSPGFLHVRGPAYNVLKTYTVEELRLADPSSSRGYEERIRRQRERQVTDLISTIKQILRDSEAEILAAKFHMTPTDQVNARIIGILSMTTGRPWTRDLESWRRWWVEEQGYAYEPPAPRTRQDLTTSDSTPTYTENVHLSSSCFAAGTPVQTLRGLRPIESIEAGDQVLMRDLRTGTLNYRPVAAAVRNKPAPLLKIGLGAETIRATEIHRFWKAGHGWVMARELKPGDPLRGLDGAARVASIEKDRSEPVFNLKILDGESFLVGDHGLLVHDNSLVEPVQKAFDASPLGPDEL